MNKIFLGGAIIMKIAMQTGSTEQVINGEGKRKLKWTCNDEYSAYPLLGMNDD